MRDNDDELLKAVEEVLRDHFACTPSMLRLRQVVADIKGCKVQDVRTYWGFRWACKYPDCDGGPSTGYCHKRCALYQAHSYLGDARWD